MTQFWIRVRKLWRGWKNPPPIEDCLPPEPPGKKLLRQAEDLNAAAVELEKELGRIGLFGRRVERNREDDDHRKPPGPARHN